MLRALNIALRTAHIASMGVLLGGQAFDAPFHQLESSLWLTVATGLALVVVESRARPLWLHQGRGIMTLVKVALLGALPAVPGHRLAVLLAAVVVGSVGSHMPSRFRHYSVVRRRIIHDGAGPGGKVPSLPGGG